LGGRGRGQLGPDDLHRHEAVEPGLAREDDDAHAPAPQYAVDLVALLRKSGTHPREERGHGRSSENFRADGRKVKRRRLDPALTAVRQRQVVAAMLTQPRGGSTMYPVTARWMIGVIPAVMPIYLAAQTLGLPLSYRPVMSGFSAALDAGGDKGGFRTIGLTGIVALGHMKADGQRMALFTPRDKRSRIGEVNILHLATYLSDYRTQQRTKNIRYERAGPIATDQF